MAGLVRFLDQNRVFGAGAVLSASSFASSLPTSYLLDQLYSKDWRSASGWTIVTGFNDKIDLVEGGTPLVATIAAGTYTTGTALGTAVAAALDAAGANTYSCTYSGPANYQFTIARTAGVLAFSLPWLTGASAATSVGKCMGYLVDQTGATSYAGATLVFQSRHFIKLDAGQAVSAKACAIIGGNITAPSLGVVRIQASTAADFSSLDLDQSLTDFTADSAGDFTLRLGYWSSISKRYWRLLIYDVANTDGFNELGYWYVGSYTEPTVRPSINFARNRDELSAIVNAIDGANHGDIRPKRDIWELEWLDLVDADLVRLEFTQDQHPPGGNFFLHFDTEDMTDVQYGYWAGGLNIRLSGPVYWSVNGVWVEALG
jgi:hypothetical protein